MFNYGDEPMSHISATRQIRKELKTRGYSLVRAAELSISDELRQAWLSLSMDYADLPPDDFLPGKVKYRFRRYGRFYFMPASEALTRLPHENYFQSSDINKVTGGMVRKFAPLLDATFDNPFLQALIRFDFRQFPLADEMKRAPWEVQVHLIRVTANSQARGYPSPEGIHRDGAEFVTVHLAELVNVEGGDVSVYDDDQNLLARYRLNQILDSYLLNDRILWHQAALIRPKQAAHQAIRSILTFDYHYASGLRSQADREL